MNLPENTIAELKQLFADAASLFIPKKEENKSEEVQKFSMQGTLDDGSAVVIEADMPQVGVAVNTMTADGQVSPIADGTYKIVAGEDTYEVVCVGGLISEVIGNPAAPTENPEPTQDMATENAGEDKFATLEARIAALEEAMKCAPAKTEEMNQEVEQSRQIVIKLQSEIEGLKNEIQTKTEAFSKLSTDVETILNTPVAEQTHAPVIKNIFSDVEAFRKKMNQ